MARVRSSLSEARFRRHIWEGVDYLPKISTETGSLTVHTEGPELVSIVVDDGTGAARTMRLNVEHAHLLVDGLQAAIHAAPNTDTCLVCGRARSAHDELDANHESTRDCNPSSAVDGPTWAL